MSDIFWSAKNPAPKNQTAPGLNFNRLCTWTVPFFFPFLSLSLSLFFSMWWLFEAWEELFQNSNYCLNLIGVC